MHWDEDSGDYGSTPITSLKEFLRELCVLSAQDPGEGEPVLELQIGDVLAKTAVERVGGVECLSVVALLPVRKQSRYLSSRSAALEQEDVPLRAATVFWSDEHRCYVATRRVPRSELVDERGVMDAILTTVDEAIGWLALIEKLHLR